MTLKDSFTSEEWATVVAAPMVAGIAVTAADPSGIVGTLRESFAVASAMQQAKGTAASPLVGEIVTAYESAEGREMARRVLKAQAGGKSTPAAIVDAALAELKDASDLVAAKAPDAAPAFREWLMAIAARVAEAGTEGGFLGFGGEKVSAAERATLDRLAAALG